MKNRPLYTLALFVSAVAVFVAGQVAPKAKPSVTTIPTVALNGGGPHWPDSRGPDYSNDQFLVGHSHNVFVGKVLNKIGTKPSDANNYWASSQYQVEAIVNVKGNLQGSVVVNQL